MIRSLTFYLLISLNLFANSLTINSHGQVGYINTPSAFTLAESSISLNLYTGKPDNKIIVTGSPFNKFDASIFYAEINGIPYTPYPGYEQSYKDKGFNFKINLKEMGKYPAISIGANDIGGTGIYSSEYIVFSKKRNNLEFSYGLGWGRYNDGITFKNPLIEISDRFKSRGNGFTDEGGSFELGRYFSGEKASLFGAISYNLLENFKLILEYDPTLTIDSTETIFPETNLNISFDYHFENFYLRSAYERGVHATFQIGTYQNFSKYQKNKPYRTVQNPKNFDDLKKILQINNIGLKKIKKNEDTLSLTVRQTSYQNQFTANKFILQAVKEIQNNSDKLIIKHDFLDMEVLKTYHSVNELENIRNEKYTDENIEKTVYALKENYPIINNSIQPRVRTFLAAREGFLFHALLLENDLEVILKENLILLANFKYSLVDNFDELFIPPKDAYPEQVRSDNKKYLNNFDNGIPIGRLELNYYKSWSRKNFLVFSAGLYEEMFGGYGAEYLYYPEGSLFGFGAEYFSLKKRDYKMNFDFLDYKNNIFRLNAFIKEPRTKIIFKLSAGEYLAGDNGYTFEAKRRFDNGVEFSAFYSKTNVSEELFGEGSFDKGIKLKIPFNLFSSKKDLGSYLWRPLTKDPAAMLVRSNKIEDLIERYRVN